RTSAHVITLTEAARRDVVRWTGMPTARVTPVPLAPRTDWSRDAAADAERLATVGVHPPYILSVAATHPHKNLTRLVQALPVRDEHNGSVPLVMVGPKGRARAELERAAGDRQGQVKVLGWVDSETLAALYRRTTALAFPSLYEGFGLPILEAMALGTPVVT